MRTSYTELSFEKLLHIKKAYIIINEKGNELFDNWNVDEFEKLVLGMGDITFIKDTEKCKEIKKALTVLDADFPFMDFTVQGQHYGYELFLLGQPNWGSEAHLFMGISIKAFFRYSSAYGRKLSGF